MTQTEMILLAALFAVLLSTAGLALGLVYLRRLHRVFQGVAQRILILEQPAAEEMEFRANQKAAIRALQLRSEEFWSFLQAEAEAAQVRHSELRKELGAATDGWAARHANLAEMVKETRAELSEGAAGIVALLEANNSAVNSQLSLLKTAQGDLGSALDSGLGQLETALESLKAADAKQQKALTGLEAKFARVTKSLREELAVLNGQNSAIAASLDSVAANTVEGIAALAADMARNHEINQQGITSLWRKLKEVAASHAELERLRSEAARLLTENADGQRSLESAKKVQAILKTDSIVSKQRLVALSRAMKMIAQEADAERAAQLLRIYVMDKTMEQANELKQLIAERATDPFGYILLAENRLSKGDESSAESYYRIAEKESEQLPERDARRGWVQACLRVKSSRVEAASRAYDVTVPMVLVTQIQRSGGTLLAQLLDHHPQIFAHPHELHIGSPEKWNWPSLDLSGNWRGWIKQLREKRFDLFFESGVYEKAELNPHARVENHPFNYDPERLVDVFRAKLEQFGSSTQRDILNAYFSAFFSAWLDEVPSGREKYISGFCPRVMMTPGSMQRFWNDYWDGKVISIIRDPRTWFVSSRLHNADIYGDVEAAIDLWNRSTRATVESQQAVGDRQLTLTYEGLTSNIRSSMERVAAFLGIEMLPTLLLPTYAGRPIRADSSFPIEQHGVVDTAQSRLASLDESALAYIEEHAMPAYREAIDLLKLQ